LAGLICRFGDGSLAIKIPCPGTVFFFSRHHERIARLASRSAKRRMDALSCQTRNGGLQQIAASESAGDNHVVRAIVAK